MAQLRRAGKPLAPWLAAGALAECDNCKRRRLAGRQATGGNDVLDDPALISELVQKVLQRRGGGSPVIAFISENAERTPFGIPPGHVK